MRCQEEEQPQNILVVVQNTIALYSVPTERERKVNYWLSAEVKSHRGGSGAFPLNAKRNMVAQPPNATGHRCTVAPTGDCGESGNVGIRQRGKVGMSALWRLNLVVHAEDSICQKSMGVAYPRCGSQVCPCSRFEDCEAVKSSVFEHRGLI